MKSINNKIITAALIVIAISLIGINFVVFSSVDRDLTESLSKLPQVVKASALSSTLLPDLKKGQLYKDSAIRNKEINLIVDQLPYTDNDNGYTISIIPKTKDIYVSILTAKTVEEYRQSKAQAEQKLYEFGAQNPCLLLIYWAQPPALKTKLTIDDVKTSSCAH